MLDEVLEILSRHGFEGALTGGLAIDLQLRLHGHTVEPRARNDVDFVVEGFDSIPTSLVRDFLFHHVHPHAPEGKTLLQLIDRDRALRIDLFRQFGTTLLRAEWVDGFPMRVVSMEDLAARLTSLVVGHLRKGETIDAKYVRSFRQLAELVDSSKIGAAWHDHRQQEAATFEEARQLAYCLLELRPELVITERYSSEVTVCPRCENYGPFRSAPPQTIVGILGYW